MEQKPNTEKLQIPEYIFAEYNAVRNEILFRLKVQQDMINYTFVAAGLLGTFLGLYAIIDIRTLLVVLLIGPIACIFLQLNYFKQHLFVELLAKYISTELGVAVSLQEGMPQHKEMPFAGWEDYLSSFYAHQHRLNFYSKLLGYAEGGFPTLIGVLFLIVFGRLMIISRHQIPDDFLLLTIWGIIDLFGLLFAVFVGTQVRGGVFRRRRVEVTKIHQLHKKSTHK